MSYTADAQAATKRAFANRAQDGLGKNLLRDVPNCRLYLNLRELELRIDQYINRKKAEICDVTQPVPTENRILRLYVYNHHHNQGSIDANFPASWSFYMYGHFVEPGQTVLPHAVHPQRGDTKKLNRWTEAMSSIEIRIEEQGEGARSPEVVRWERARHMGAHRECVELHRCGSTPAKIKVSMIRDFVPERFTVTGALREVVFTPTATRGQVLQAMWNYINAHSRADDKDPATVICDASLQRIMGLTPGDPRLQLASVSDRIDAYLQPTQPIEIQYDIQLQGPSPSHPHCYDIEVSVPLKESALKLPAFLERLAKDKDVQQCNEEISKNMRALQDAHQRYNFLSGFATAPVEFTQNLMAAAAKQTRLHQTAENTQEYRAMPASEHFKMPWAQEAVVKYLQRSTAIGL